MTTPAALVIVEAIGRVRRGESVDLDTIKIQLAAEDERLEYLAEREPSFADDAAALRGFNTDMTIVLEDLERSDADAAEVHLYEFMSLATTGLLPGEEEMLRQEGLPLPGEAE
ncbi:MAG: hypothetical protein ACRDJV_13530 [Actinomycetota bacterium]